MLAERDTRLVADEIAPWWPSRYGAGDQIGSLNEITPAAIVAAARLVRQGKVFDDLGRILDETVPHFPGRFWRQTLVANAHLNNPARPDGTDSGWGKNQVNWLIELATGTFQIGTQLDGLNHLRHLPSTTLSPHYRGEGVAPFPRRDCRQAARPQLRGERRAWPVWHNCRRDIRPTNDARAVARAGAAQSRAVTDGW